MTIEHAQAAVAILEERIAALRTEQAIPGVAAAVLKDGEIVGEYNCGRLWIDGPTPTSESVFRIASMTKSFTAAAILLLRDRGSLRLDDPVADFLAIAQPDGPELTIRDLLTMNGGLPTDDPWGDRQEDLPYPAFDEMVALGLSFARTPRTGFEYSNAGYAILGRVISIVSGVDYLEFVRRELLEPLGMSASTFWAAEVPAGSLAIGHAQFDAGLTPLAPVGPGSFSAMGGLHSTVRDLARWVLGFVLPSDHPLSAWSRVEMQQPCNWARTTVVENDTVTASYGFGLLVDHNSALGRFVHHSGGYPGYGSHMRWHPESGWGVVLLANRTYANMRRVGEESMNAIVAEFGVRPAPSLWPRTVAAIDVCERLLSRWDDGLCDEWFAVNVDLDRPRPERRAEWTRIGEGLTAVSRGAVESTSPAHASWVVRDGESEVRLEVLMSPENPPRIQHLSCRRL